MTWKVTYTLDAGLTKESILVHANTFTEAYIIALRELPPECAIGSSKMGILSIILDQNSVQTDTDNQKLSQA